MLQRIREDMTLRFRKLEAGSWKLVVGLANFVPESFDVQGPVSFSFLERQKLANSTSTSTELPSS